MSAELSDWCDRYLGAVPREEIFHWSHLSQVIGVVLSDGRSVVIKVRPRSPRLAAITALQREFHRLGFPCPEVLAGPAPFRSSAATAETYVPPSSGPPDRVPAEPVAELLGRLVEIAPPPDAFRALDPPPPWVGWDHDGDGLWPWPDDLDVDLNDHPGPAWIDGIAARVRERLRRLDVPLAIGHIDWEAQNLGWRGDMPVVVHDWDSLAIRPEATIAGVAAATFVSNGRDVVAATVADTAAFLAAYHQLRPAWTAADDAVAWSAGLWVLAFNAKKESVGGGGGYLEHLERELDARIAHTGL